MSLNKFNSNGNSGSGRWMEIEAKSLTTTDPVSMAGQLNLSADIDMNNNDINNCSAIQGGNITLPGPAYLLRADGSNSTLQLNCAGVATNTCFIDLCDEGPCDFTVRLQKTTTNDLLLVVNKSGYKEVLSANGDTGCVDIKEGIVINGQMRLPLYVADPVAGNTNGMMYYDTVLNELKVFKSGTWKTITTS